MPGMFNPWRDLDPEHDLGPQSPRIRAEQLQRYLSERLGRARLVLIAEALGYQGGHFSGIAMTSERILLGHQVGKNIQADDVIEGGGQRTSRVGERIPANGMTEPTATIAWGALKAAGLDTREVVLWNAFAWHPMKAHDAWLTNRKPSDKELAAGRPVLEHFLSLIPGAQVVAVGGVSHGILSEMGVSVATQVRHPAYGGAKVFRQQMADFFAQRPGTSP